LGPKGGVGTEEGFEALLHLGQVGWIIRGPGFLAEEGEEEPFDGSTDLDGELVEGGGGALGPEKRSMEVRMRVALEGVAELNGRGRGKPGVVEGEGDLVEVEGAVERFRPGQAEEVLGGREEGVDVGGLGLDSAKVAERCELMAIEGRLLEASLPQLEEIVIRFE
jgi:hypothetical protein